ncbi:hypothetical protein LSCM1_06662 [Leishmania martiniquensis]|uniref:RRM domain-containing protein n=1 Tax=Leishmania martiniquensis TaxID=1580590 RepID=A0A836HQX3_9TRYP|nr:hypothetical protein LSCM1_06662 [Leishmania martiniquensis]
MNLPTTAPYYTPSSTNLFIRYLPREVDDNRLREIFSVFGNITSSMVMRDIHSGQSLGTAFVRYEAHEEAVRALRDAHGMPLFGKTVSVQWAKQQHDGTPAGSDRLRMNKLFLRNVPLEATEGDLVDLVSSHGSVVRVTMHNDTAPLADSTERRRIAFITFENFGAAEAALRAVHNTCAFPQCRGIPLMGKLSEDYTQKVRTPRRLRNAQYVQKSLSKGSRTDAYSSRVPRLEDTMHFAVEESVSGRNASGNTSLRISCVPSIPLSLGSVRAIPANHITRCANVAEERRLPRMLRVNVSGADFEALPGSTCERAAAPTTICALDSGITVTVRLRTSARTSKSH